MLVQRLSSISGKINSMELNVTQAQLNQYDKGGVLLQNVFPNLKPDEREFIKTGITKQEWNEMFGDPEEAKQVEVDEESEDLFEDYDNLPQEVKDVMATWDDSGDEYHECGRIEKELEAIGYSVEWGLDGQLFNLKKVVK